MFGIKFNLASIAQLGLAAMTGGTSLLASTALRTIGSQIAMNVIQRLGQQMGLPQPMIDLAQAAFANRMGMPGLARQNIGEAVRGFTQQLDLRPSDAGRLERQLNETADQSYANFMRIAESFARRSVRGSGGSSDEEGGSILMKIAEALGELMDEKMNKLALKAEELGQVGRQTGNSFTSGQNEGGFTARGQGEFGKLSAQVQALGQEVSYLSQALSTTLKSIGEASATVARK
jgi:hypothetical protein